MGEYRRQYLVCISGRTLLVYVNQNDINLTTTALLFWVFIDTKAIPLSTSEAEIWSAASRPPF